MTFLLRITKGHREGFNDSTLKVLADHAAVETPVRIVDDEAFSAAMLDRIYCRTYDDGITVLYIGRPVVRDNEIPQERALDFIHQLYIEDGEKFIHKIKGAFGLVVIDKRRKINFVFRDRMGFYPIFYCDAPDGLLLSNSIKLILSSSAVAFSLNHEAIFRYLFLKAFECPDTPVDEVYSLEPGCLLSYNVGKVETRRYWDLPLPSERFNNTELKDKKEELTVLLQQVLQEQASISHIRSGLLLSGGIDSSLLAALMTGNGDYDSGRDVTAFNINFSEAWKDLDESQYAEIVADRCSMKLQKIEFSLDNLLNSLPTLFWNNNLPTANTGFKLSLVAERGISQDINTYVLGEGADTLLDYSWKWKYFNPMYKAAFLSKVFPESINAGVLRIAEGTIHYLQSKYFGKENPLEILRSFFGVQLGYWKWKGSRIRINELVRLFDGKLRNDMGSGLLRNVFSEYYERVDSGELAEKLIYSSLKSYTPNQQLMNYQTICNFYGANLACPYLDEDIIEFCLRLPVDNRVDKRILKSISENIVPHEIINREKRVFIVPMETWMKENLRPFVELAFSEKNISKRGFFDYREMSQLKESFYRGDFQSWSDIWSFILLEAWLRINYDVTTPSRPETVQDIFPELEEFGFVKSKAE
jgi:asparagine synthase (glutamine-hydrolysing)